LVVRRRFSPGDSSDTFKDTLENLHARFASNYYSVRIGISDVWNRFYITASPYISYIIASAVGSKSEVY